MCSWQGEIEAEKQQQKMTEPSVPPFNNTCHISALLKSHVSPYQAQNMCFLEEKLESRSALK